MNEWLGAGTASMNLNSYSNVEII